MTDDDLAGGAMRRDSDAFSELVRRNYGRVYFSALSITRDVDTAEDLAQETFLRAWLKIDTLRDPASLLPWLGRIARNQATLWLRTGQTRSRLLPLISMEEITAEPHDSLTPTPRQQAGDKEQSRQLAEAVMELPEDLRQAVLLHYVEGMSPSDIARLNGESPSTVTRRLDRARTQLRAHLESGLAAGLAIMKPGPRALEKALTALAAAAVALPTATHARLFKLAGDTPPPPIIDPVISGATMGSFLETGIIKGVIENAGGAKLLSGFAAAAIIGGGVYTVFSYSNFVSKSSAYTGKPDNGARITALGSNDAERSQIENEQRKRNTADKLSRLRKTHDRDSNSAVVTTPTGLKQSDKVTTATKEPVGFFVVSGGVYDEVTSEPLANTIVRAALPPEDMRASRKKQKNVNMHSTTADASGHYELKIPLYDEISSMSLDALLPGYRSLAGSYAQRGDDSKYGTTVSPGDLLKIDLSLPKAAYFSGHVFDEDGNPLPGVQAQGSVTKVGQTIGFDLTDENGHFEMYDFPEHLEDLTTRGQAMIKFTCPDRMTTTIANIYQVSESGRTNLRVVISDGYTVAGQLLQTSGGPAASLPLHIEYPDKLDTHEGITDAGGNFAFKGVEPGSVVLYAVTPNGEQRLRQEINVPLPGDLTLRLQPSQEADESAAVTLLGMKLIEITPELAEKYLLDSPYGVLVLDEGPNVKRLNLARKSILDEGAVFWSVGKIPIKNLQQFVSTLLRVNSKPRPDGFDDDKFVREGFEGYVRVVYDINRFRVNNSTTQFIRLTDDDVEELKNFYTRRYGSNPPGI